jgi:hypothetical protein
MYCTTNFPTKKALKQAIADHQADPTNHPPVRIFQPGPFGGSEPTNGTVALEGPHYPQPHRWYAQATLTNGIVTSIK